MSDDSKGHIHSMRYWIVLWLLVNIGNWSEVIGYKLSNDQETFQTCFNIYGNIAIMLISIRSIFRSKRRRNSILKETIKGCVVLQLTKLPPVPVLLFSTIDRTTQTWRNFLKEYLSRDMRLNNVSSDMFVWLSHVKEDGEIIDVDSGVTAWYIIVQPVLKDWKSVQQIEDELIDHTDCIEWFDALYTEWVISTRGIDSELEELLVV